MPGRVAAYAGASVAASAAVILRAFHERPNFYSATVYLGQSTACRMILVNMLLLTLASSIYGLQRFLYGPLRAIEVEQLWDKAWYAITETALAMTTFRDEVGGYFFIMFMTLLAGKVWGWIAEGRVDTLEQQPPANPKTFHARMVASLIISEVFDLIMLRYCARAILDQKAPRAGMMVMFVFEFAILAINSTSTVARYALALQERYIVQKQTRVKMDERKEEIRVAREEARRLQIEQNTEGTTIPPPVPVTDDEVDENEIDVPGWQEKGVYILFLDLATDFLKLVFYVGFFMIIFFFAGIPIHMFRDLFNTTRSFLKRISDYLKYRNATRDMNSRYPDATPAELERDGTCIICREEMRPWETPDAGAPGGGAGARANAAPPDERRRPKKLPCGHILHVSCLRSWLERQQVCPTCRRSVLAPRPPPTNTNNPQDHHQHQHQPQANGGQGPNPQGPAGNNNGNGQAPGPNQRRGNHGLRARTINLGIARLTFATGNAQQVQHALQQVRDQPGGNGGANNANNDIRGVLEAVNARDGNSRRTNNAASSVQDQVQSVERQIMHEIGQLNLAQSQLATVRALQTELSRLRLVQNNPAYADTTPNGTQQSTQQPTVVPQTRQMTPQYFNAAQTPQVQHVHGLQQQVLGSESHQASLGPGHADLPEGVTIPQGWSLLPLQRLGPEPHTGVQEASEGDLAADMVVGQAPYQPQVGAHPSAAETTFPVNPQSSADVEPGQASRPEPELPPPAPSSSSIEPASTIVKQPTTGSSSNTDTNPEVDPQLFTGLPDWGTSSSTNLNSTSQTVQSSNLPNAHNHEDPEPTQHPSDSHNSDPHGESSMNGSARLDKGKGRAVTVEEERDEER